MKPPAPAASLVPELVAYLGSPDPRRRDAIAYEVLDRWIAKSTLADADVRSLATQLVDNLRTGDTVFRRSFSALVLASIIRRDVTRPFLDDPARHAILAAAKDYADRETDLRGYTGVTGWAHPAAHTADLLAQLAKEPSFTDDDRAHILDAVAGFIARKHGTIFHHGEDGRLAVAVIAAIKRGVPKAIVDAWLATLKAPLLERGGAEFDAGLYGAQRNARNLLFTLFVQTSVAPEPTDGERALLEAVRSIIAS